MSEWGCPSTPCPIDNELHTSIDSGVGSYEELDIRLAKAKERVVRSAGNEAFREMLARLPLTPTDEAVEAIAREHGWQDEFMTISRANLPIQTTRLRPPVGNHEVPRMFRAQVAQRDGEVAGGAPAARAFGSNAPLPAVPPPRPPRRAPAAAAPPAAAPATVSKASPPTPAPEPLADAAPHADAPVAGAPNHGHGNAEEDFPICAVCQDEIRGGASELSVFDCGHVFHQICIARWRRVSNSEVLRCPVCRHVTPQQDDWIIPQDIEDDEPQGLQEVGTSNRGDDRAARASEVAARAPEETEASEAAIL